MSVGTSSSFVMRLPGLGAGDVHAVDRDVRQPRLRAADLHELAFAFVAFGGDAGHARRRFGRVGVWQRADHVAREHGDDVVRGSLFGERLLDRLIETG